MVNAGSIPPDKIADLEDRLASRPDSLLFLPLAEAYRQAGRLGESERVLRAGLVRHPDHHSARTALGRVLIELDRREEARAELQKALVAVPDNLLARRLLGEVARCAPRPETASRDSSPQPSPSAAPVVAHAAPGGGGAERPAPAAEGPEAVGAAETPGPDRPFPEPSPADELSSLTLGELYLRQGDWEAALEIFRDVADREPGNREVARRVRWLEKEMGQSTPRDGEVPPSPGAPLLPTAASGPLAVPERRDPRLPALRRFLAGARRLREQDA